MVAGAVAATGEGGVTRLGDEGKWRRQWPVMEAVVGAGAKDGRRLVRTHSGLF